MFAEIIQLNKMFKTNDFTRIKPKLHNSRVVFVIDQTKVIKKGGKKENVGCAVLSEVEEATSLDTVLKFFDIDPSVEQKFVEKLNLSKMAFTDKLK